MKKRKLKSVCCRSAILSHAFEFDLPGFYVSKCSKMFSTFAVCYSFIKLDTNEKILELLTVPSLTTKNTFKLINALNPPMKNSESFQRDANEVGRLTPGLLMRSESEVNHRCTMNWSSTSSALRSQSWLRYQCCHRLWMKPLPGPFLGHFRPPSPYLCCYHRRI